MVITFFSPMVVDHLISSLSTSFLVKDLGQLSCFFGVELDYLLDNILLTQRKYVSDLLHKTSMNVANPISSPMTAYSPLSKHDSPSFDNLTLFCSIIGSLQYLSLIRLAIYFSANKICQFMHEPTTSHWVAVKRIIRYLKTVFFSPNILPLLYMPILILIRLDALMRDVLLVGITSFQAIISFLKFKNQYIVTHSSTEVEYKYPLSIPLLNLFNYNTDQRTWIFTPHPLFCNVTILVPYI